MKRLLSFSILCVMFSQVCAFDALSVDRSVSSSVQLSFPNEKNIQPEVSDFSVLNYVLMSNEHGERWAVLTIKNRASGNRALNQDHLIGLLANGERIHPQAFKQWLSANESVSLTIAFGKNKFPLLEIYSRKNK